MQGKKQYQEKLFLSFRLSDRIPEDNFYRRLKGVLDLAFVPQFTSQYYGKEGQKSIDPIVFFKLMLIGYIENLNSDRKIVEHASMRMDMLYFIGYDIDESLPWHSTLSRTRQLYGEELFLEVFRKVLSLCVEKGMVNGRCQAIDSAYIKANALMESIIPKKLKEDTADYLKKLTENEEENLLPKEKKQKTGKSNRDWESPSDPDARISKKNHKPAQLNYASQISVDTASHVICGAMADFADKRDAQSLPDLLDQVINSLERESIQIEDVLADTNYSSGESLRYLESKNIEGYIPCYGPYKYKRDDFTYNREENCYVCSQGKKLPFKKIMDRKENGKRKVYWSSKTDCKNCPKNTECIGNREFKTIEDTINKPYYDRMYERVKTKKGKQMKILRSSTAEPVLGTLLHFLGMKKVYTKGIKLANKHVLMATTAYNIKKLMKFKAVNYAQIGTKSFVEAIICPTFQFFNLFFNEITYFFANLKFKLVIIA
jgi:transposase